jgi:cardiolipin synthase A/B
VNLRNHRKILVVDGKIGFTGGFNIKREYWNRESERLCIGICTFAYPVRW